MPAIGRACSVAALLAVVAVSTACDTNDGRDLRPADPDQIESISVPGTAGAAQLPELETTTTLVATLPVEPDPWAVGAPWVDGGSIDPQFTCDGDDISPSISWPAAPDGTASIGVAMVDDQAPDFVHWTLTGLDPARTSLAEGETPDGVIRGTNGRGELGYTGPCPPDGEAHTYRIIVFYLDAPLDATDGTPGAELVEALTATSFDSAQVTGIYRRAGA